MLMLSATPVNNRFTDLKNQLALAYEGDSENLSAKLDVGNDIEEIFRQAQAAFNAWSKLPPEERTAAAILDALDFDFFELLDSRHHRPLPQAHPDVLRHHRDRQRSPSGCKPISVHCPLTDRPDVIGFNEIFEQLSMLQARRLRPARATSFPSRLAKYEELYDTEVSGGGGKLRAGGPREEPAGADDGQPAQAAGELRRGVPAHAPEAPRQPPRNAREDRAVHARRASTPRLHRRRLAAFENAEPDDDEFPDPDDSLTAIGGKVQDRPRRHGPALVGA